MTDSTAQNRGGKRERLVASAGDLLHRNGIAATTLAQVAEAAGVPPGNVYYYFKTKDELVRAVIDARCDQVRAMLGSLQSRRSPGARVKALAHQWVEMRDLVARYGCPFGALATEVDRGDDRADGMAAKPIGMILDWAENQFRELGPRRRLLRRRAGRRAAGQRAAGPGHHDRPGAPPRTLDRHTLAWRAGRRLALH
jgi:TetR/AcrR family transcriptional regulator, transcriptional repressor for nem operon